MAVNKKKTVGRPPANQGGLSKAVIVESAKKLMAKDGKVPSIREVAQELNIDAMAIYHYFKNKADLLEAVTVSLVTDIYEPAKSDDWKIELTNLCFSYLRLLKDHAGLLETMLSMSVAGPSEVFAERLTLALSPLDLDDETLNDALALLADYLHGYALAMHCCNEEGALTIDMTIGPLRLYMRALEASQN